MTDPNRLLSVKELAFELGRHTSYVYRMTQVGFPMNGGRTTLRQAREWLSRNPAPYSRKKIE